MHISELETEPIETEREGRCHRMATSLFLFFPCAPSRLVRHLRLSASEQCTLPNYERLRRNRPRVYQSKVNASDLIEDMNELLIAKRKTRRDGVLGEYFHRDKSPKLIFKSE